MNHFRLSQISLHSHNRRYLRGHGGITQG